MPKGITRVCMNYVISDKDIKDKAKKLSKLKIAANKNGISLIVNTNFKRSSDKNKQKHIEAIAKKYSDFNLKHTTDVNGICQMGAGSSITVDYDGTILRCPYMDNKDGVGNFLDLREEDIKKRVKEFFKNKKSCVMRM